MGQKTSIDLYTLQTRLKDALEDACPEKLWVHAEISAIKSRGGGHCYMELSQSSEAGLAAKAQAIIWASKFRMLAPYFQSVAGIPLQEGINVLVRVQVNFSQLYGLSLVVDDIDPEFTLGDKERKRQETIDRLNAEGLMDRQKELALSALPYRLAVISAPDAAGYRDFMRHLHENEYGFVFHTDLFEAVMQGVAAPESIAEAIRRASEAQPVYDAVLILRGGGAKLDLACFDEYVIAAAIANCPIPVITAVGHDQDHHICDMVAWKYVKTPTALADEFLDIYAEEDYSLASYGSRLKMAFLNKIAAMSSRIDLFESRILNADPRRILSRGYVLALDGDNVVMKSSLGSKSGDRMSIMFADGTLDCSVTGRRADRKEKG